MAEAPAARLPGWVPALYVLAGTVLFGGLNCWNAARMSPNWGMDLAFFHQLVHSAATGGPWASPLLLEAEGFFEMVHTHLVLPLVVLAYRAVPRQETLLVLHGLFAALALWPALRLGEVVGGRRLALIAPLSLVVLPPFQGMATADFRPSVLFFAGVLGIFAAARERRLPPALAWALLALVAREEGVYLVALAGLSLCLLPWGMPAEGKLSQRYLGGLRLKIGLALLLLAGAAFAAWVAVKPSMFHYINPWNMPEPAALDADTVSKRLRFLAGLARSGALLGLLSPAPLLGLLPIAEQMSTDHRGWNALTGPSAHYPAFWLPWLVAAAIAGAGRLPRWGPPLLLFLNATCMSWVLPREGPVELRELEAHVLPDDRVAASYPTIHRFAGREVLWNTAQLRMRADERPRGWEAPWPVPLGEVDVLVVQEDDVLAERARGAGWSTVASAGGHVVLRPHEADASAAH